MLVQPSSLRQGILILTTGLVTSGREETAARANQSLPSPSLYCKPHGANGWADPKLKDLQTVMCFHRSALDCSDKQAPLWCCWTRFLHRCRMTVNMPLPPQMIAPLLLLWLQECLKHMPMRT